MEIPLPVPGVQFSCSGTPECVAVPQIYVKDTDLRSSHRLHVLCVAYGHELEVTVIELEGSTTLEDVVLQVFNAGLDRVEIGEVRIGDRIVPLLLPTEVEVEFQGKDRTLKVQDELAQRDTFAMEAYRPVLRLLAQLSGYRIRLYRNGAMPHLAPYPQEDGVIHLAVNTSPPGPSLNRSVRAICGHLLHPGAEAWSSNGPTEGRGVIMKDQYGDYAVQILGTTWYLLVPIFGPYNPHTSVDILSALLVLGWKGAREPPPESEPLSREAFTEQFVAMRAHPDELFREHAREIQGRIAELQRQLAEEKYFLRRLLTIHEHSMSSDLMRRSAQLGPVDYERILGGGVTRITTQGDAFHFHTAPIVIEHDGVHYDIGELTIHIGELGQLYVWTDTPRHKDGIAHPHVGTNGSPCLGNATEAILDAVAEDRIGDAVLHLMSWLIHGYTPELAASHKIEEWPHVS